MSSYRFQKYGGDLSIEDTKHLRKATEIMKINIPKYNTSLIDYDGMMNIVNDFHHNIDVNMNEGILNFAKFDKWSQSLPINDYVNVNKIMSQLIASMRTSLLRQVECIELKNYKINQRLASGVEGTTYSGNIEHPTIKYRLVEDDNSKEIPIVIKIINGSDDNNYKEEIIHEAAIGVALNSIATKTPNFMYFYGLLPCDIEINPYNIKESNICTGTEYPGYPVYEYIKGKTLADMIKAKELKRNEIINILCQVLLSLSIASKEILFTHYDLHLNNIMIVSLPQPMSVMYEMDGMVFKWNTKYLAKIIDYGRAYALYDGVHIVKNMTGFEQYGFRAGPNHQFDIVNLIKRLKLFNLMNHLLDYDLPKTQTFYYKYAILPKEQNNYNFSGISIFDNIIKEYNVSIFYSMDSNLILSRIPRQDIYDVIDFKRDRLCLSLIDEMNDIKRRILQQITSSQKPDQDLLKIYNQMMKQYINDIVNNHNDIVDSYNRNLYKKSFQYEAIDKVYSVDYLAEGKKLKKL